MLTFKDGNWHDTIVHRDTKTLWPKSRSCYSQFCWNQLW